MDFPEGIKEEDHPVPWALKAAYAIIVVWCLWYLASSMNQHGTRAVATVDEQVLVR